MRSFIHSARLLTLLLAALFSFAALLQAQGTPKPKKEKKKKGEAAQTVALKNYNDSVSYAIGVVLSESFKMQGLDSLNLDLMKEAMKTAMAGKPTAMKTEDANTLLQTMSMKQREKQNAKLAAEAAENKKKGQEWLAENGKKPGVITLPSGLQYQVITQTEGPKPTINSRVTCHYLGTLTDGSKFDSSWDRGEPATFPLNGVILGWQEGVPLMSVGSKYRFFIPSDLGYGERGSPPAIPGNSVLIFEVELISFE